MKAHICPDPERGTCCRRLFSNKVKWNITRRATTHRHLVCVLRILCGCGSTPTLSIRNGQVLPQIPLLKTSLYALSIQFGQYVCPLVWQSARAPLQYQFLSSLVQGAFPDEDMRPPDAERRAKATIKKVMIHSAKTNFANTFVRVSFTATIAPSNR